jgi:hypothetical protein
LPIAAI